MYRKDTIGGIVLSKVTVSGERCKACGICIRECPRKAIAFGEKLNTKGYKVVKVDDEKCIGCGICYAMCPDCVLELEG